MRHIQQTCAGNFNRGEDFTMGNDIKVTLVKPGDVIQGDGSWQIDQLEPDNHKLLTIIQSLKDISDRDLPVASFDPYYQRPLEWVVDYDGPVSSLIADVIDGNFVTIAEKEGISVKGKNFLVTEVVNPGKCSEFHVTARELTDKYEINPDGLTVTFNQNSKYTGHNALYDVKVIGRRKPTFGPFEPEP
jgi:hypothetical protein